MRYGKHACEGEAPFMGKEERLELTQPSCSGDGHSCVCVCEREREIKKIKMCVITCVFVCFFYILRNSKMLLLSFQGIIYIQRLEFCITSLNSAAIKQGFIKYYIFKECNH